MTVGVGRLACFWARASRKEANSARCSRKISCCSRTSVFKLDYYIGHKLVFHRAQLLNKAKVTQRQTAPGQVRSDKRIFDYRKRGRANTGVTTYCKRVCEIVNQKD